MDREVEVPVGISVEELVNFHLQEDIDNLLEAVRKEVAVDAFVITKRTAAGIYALLWEKGWSKEKIDEAAHFEVIFLEHGFQKPLRQAKSPIVLRSFARSLHTAGVSTGTQRSVDSKRHTSSSPIPYGSKKQRREEEEHFLSIRESPPVALAKNACSSATTTNSSSAMTTTDASLAAPPTTTSSATMTPNMLSAASPPNAPSATMSDKTTSDFDAKALLALADATPMAQTPNTPESLLLYRSHDSSPAMSVSSRNASTNNALNYVDYGEDEPRAQKPRKSDTPRHVYMTRRRSKAVADDIATANEETQDYVDNIQTDAFSAEGLPDGGESDGGQRSKNDEKSDHEQSGDDEDPESVVQPTTAKPGKIRLPRPTASAHRTPSPPPLEMHHEDEFPPPDQRNALQQMLVDQLRRNGQLVQHIRSATIQEQHIHLSLPPHSEPHDSFKPSSSRPTDSRRNTRAPKQRPAPRHSCNYCDYRTSRKDCIDQHLRKHTGSKPFVCEECGHRTAWKSALDVHRKIHTGEKPYACPYANCDYRAKTKSGLTDHERRHHTHVKPHACQYSNCNYKATNSGDLDRHVRIHTGEKAFQCAHCAYATAQIGDLHAHLRTHTGEKPYKCSQCEYQTTTSSHLNDHVRRHH